MARHQIEVLEALLIDINSEVAAHQSQEIDCQGFACPAFRALADRYDDAESYIVELEQAAREAA